MTKVFLQLGETPLGDLVEDAPYYRLTRAEARERYAFVKGVVGC